LGNECWCPLFPWEIRVSRHELIWNSLRMSQRSTDATHIAHKDRAGFKGIGLLKRKDIECCWNAWKAQHFFSCMSSLRILPILVGSLVGTRGKRSPPSCSLDYPDGRLSRDTDEHGSL
jgi:hypothetical protein